MARVEDLYDAAERAGLLTPVVVGTATVYCAFRAPDETVLDGLGPALRDNIRARGAEALARLRRLQDELGGAITNVQGTGLLFSCELSPEYKCYGAGSTEEWLRRHGLNVIHGGANSLRFTPHFGIDAEELELLVTMVGRALREGPRARQAAAA